MYPCFRDLDLGVENSACVPFCDLFTVDREKSGGRCPKLRHLNRGVNSDPPEPGCRAHSPRDPRRGPGQLTACPTLHPAEVTLREPFRREPRFLSHSPSNMPVLTPCRTPRFHPAVAHAVSLPAPAMGRGCRGGPCLLWFGWWGLRCPHPL